MRKYWAIFQVQLLNNVAYIGNFLAGSGMIVLFMFIFAQLWRAAYSATGNGPIAGLRYEDVLWYLMLAEVIELSKPRLAQGIAQSVRDGSVAYQLTKPYNYILYQCGVGLGDSALKVLINAVVGGGILVGTEIYTPLSQATVGSLTLRFNPGAVIGWAVVLLVLGLLSALAAARRVLAIDPIEATTGGGNR